MGLMFEEYDKGFKIVSIVFDECAKNDLLNDKLDFLYCFNNKVLLFPEHVYLKINEKDYDKLIQYNNYDVFEIWPNGYLKLLYDTASGDNSLFVTNRCNSNCLMCPSPERFRKESTNENISMLIELARHIPVNVNHITITGGEPFLAGESIFELLEFLKYKFENTDFLILTNGRVFSISKYVNRLIETLPNNCILGIPIHASCENIHDSITQVKNSFVQTQIGIERLLARNVKVEIRVVVSKMNWYDMEKIAHMIVKQFAAVHHVSIMAMEMTGNAYVNRETLWMPYREVFNAIKNAIMIIMQSGIDVRLYNFPLCVVDEQYRALCEKSISIEKIRYAESCDVCEYKTACGGVFAGTYELVKTELKKI